MLSPVANALLSGIVEWGPGSGVDTIIVEMNSLWILRLVQYPERGPWNCALSDRPIILTPDDSGKDLSIVLRGDLAWIRAVATGQKQKPGAFGDAGFSELASQVSLVAGTGFEPVTFRL